MNRLYSRIVSVYLALLGIMIFVMFFYQSSHHALRTHPVVYFVAAAYLLAAAVLCWLNKVLGLVLGAVYFVVEFLHIVRLTTDGDLAPIGAAVFLLAAVIDRFAKPRRPAGSDA